MYVGFGCFKLGVLACVRSVGFGCFKLGMLAYVHRVWLF